MVRQVVALPLVYKSYVWYSPDQVRASHRYHLELVKALARARRRAGGDRDARARLRGPRRSRPAHRGRGSAATGAGQGVTAVRVPEGGPLTGLRVLELGTLLAGPFTGRLLGDLGAEVIKVEAPGKPARSVTGARPGTRGALSGGRCSPATRSASRSTCGNRGGRSCSFGWWSTRTSSPRTSRPAR